MKSKFALAALAAVVATPMAAVAPASAQYYGGYDRGYYDRGGYPDRGAYRDGRGYQGRDGYYGDRVYQGRGGYYRSSCRRSSGTTGGVLGAVGGGLIGNALGGGTLGTLLGAGGGALLGRSLDQRHDAAQNWRNGC